MGDGTRSPRSLLTPAVLNILMALAEEPRHGLGIKTAIEERTEGRLTLGPGTLYEAIHRLKQDGWIEEVVAPPGQASGRRRFYKLTRAGRSVMEEELLRLDAIVAFARDRSLIPEQA